VAREAQAPEKQTERETRQGEDVVVVCAACNHALTKASARIEVDGHHEHAFANPDGYTFRVACYRDAPGCTGAGPESTFWTWFKGFAWRVALCGGCGAHVGWSYRSDASSFFGLVVDRIKAS